MWLSSFVKWKEAVEMGVPKGHLGYWLATSGNNSDHIGPFSEAMQYPSALIAL